MTKSPKIIAYISLGSNMGDRLKYLKRAKQLLAGHSDIRILKASAIYETEPWPLHDVSDNRKINPHRESGTHWFLNQVIGIETTLLPLPLLSTLEEIEKKLGRKHKQHWDNREIDLDILLYSSEVINLQKLEVPHRHMKDRQFILIPLLEIEPTIKDPVLGRPYQKFLEEIKDDHKITPLYNESGENY